MADGEHNRLSALQKQKEAEEVLATLAASYRDLAQAEAAHRASISVVRKSLNETLYRALKVASSGLPRSAQLELAAKAYWGCPDLPAEPMERALGFSAHTGRASNGIPFYDTGKPCGKCGGSLLATSRGSFEQNYRYCLKCRGYYGQTPIDEILAERGAVSFNTAGEMAWVND